MLVGHDRKRVQAAARQRTHALVMRKQVAAHVFRQIERQQVLQAAVQLKEIETRAIRSETVGALVRTGGTWTNVVVIVGLE
ncbi:hypothetical protein D3C72_2307740 [compost metagenome]